MRRAPNSYEPDTGRLARKDYRNADGVLERTVDLEYDAIGRVVERVHTQPATGEEVRFRFRHDGDLGDGDPVGGQKGYTSQVEGPAYASTTVRNPDGSEASSTLVLAGWMQIDVANTYYANGSLKEAHRLVTRLLDGQVIDDVTTAYIYDTWGRVDHIDINGDRFATAHYDEEGRFASVDLPDGQRVEHQYDPVTHLQNGYTQEIGQGVQAWQAGVSWAFNNRGLIASETIDLAGASWVRSCRYDSRGFLTRAEDREQVSTYTYTPSGLPNQITDTSGTRTVSRGSSRTITVAGIPYAYDASGRLIARGSATFTYGPDGHLLSADLGTRLVGYQYSAEGERILKYEGGVPVAAFVGGGYLTNDTFISPVELGARLVGVLEAGTFHLLATDPRGTLLTDTDGTPRLASAYGVRTTHPDLSAALDYVEKGYDATLETIRMGVRDYDPVLAQFWTPDPLYLENIDKCAERPVDCNLFSYARNNPVMFVDPTGMDWKAPFRWIGREVVPRLLGAAKTVGAGAAFGLGYGLCNTMAGCVIGGPLEVASADYGASGIQEVWYGTPQPTIAERISPTAGDIEAAMVNTAALYRLFASPQYLQPSRLPVDKGPIGPSLSELGAAEGVAARGTTAVGPAARTLGLDQAGTQALLAGEQVAFETPGIVGFAQMQGSRLTAGIFSVNAPGQGVQALMQFRAQAAALGRALGATELELMGAEFTNSSLRALLIRQGFETATVEAPAALGGGPMEVLRKVFGL